MRSACRESLINVRISASHLTLLGGTSVVYSRAVCLLHMAASWCRDAPRTPHYERPRATNGTEQREKNKERQIYRILN